MGHGGGRRIAGAGLAKVTSERLGHSPAAFTMDVRAASLPDMQEEAAEKMEAMLETA